MSMNCRRALPFLEDLAAGAPAQGPLEAAKAHAAACPSCALALTRARRLQSLLSLKRHERPDAFAERTFLPEFHRRLYASIVRRRTFASRLRDLLSVDGGMPAMVRGLALASALVLSLLSLYTVHASLRPGTSPVLAQQAASRHAPGLNEVAFQPPSANSPVVYVLDRVSYAPRMDDTAVLSF
jgi:hypothetical protein